MKDLVPQYQNVKFAFCIDALLHEAHVDSSYIASSLYAVSEPKTSVLPYIVTDDETPFIRRAVAEAFSAIVPRLQAYIADASISDEGCILILRLPVTRHKTCDELLMHELQRAFVTYILSKWYDTRLPDKSLQQQRLYEAAVSMALHDIHLAEGRVVRKSTYF